MMKHVSCTHIETKVPLNGLVQQRQEEIRSIGSREVSWDPSYHLGGWCWIQIGGAAAAC